MPTVHLLFPPFFFPAQCSSPVMSHRCRNDYLVNVLVSGAGVVRDDLSMVRLPGGALVTTTRCLSPSFRHPSSPGYRDERVCLPKRRSQHLRGSAVFPVHCSSFMTWSWIMLLTVCLTPLSLPSCHFLILVVTISDLRFRPLSCGSLLSVNSCHRFEFRPHFALGYS